MKNKAKKVAIFVSFSGHGGVERMVVNLCQGMTALGIQVDLLLVRTEGVYLEQLPASVHCRQLKASHTWGSIFELAAYLRREKPTALLAVKDRAGRAALIARYLSTVRTRVVMRIGTTVSAALDGCSPLRKAAWYLPMRFFYPRLDGIIAVSRGVADDVLKITHIEHKKLHVVANPVITDGLKNMAAGKPEHDWFKNKKIPVIMGIGRFTRQKDFSTLIEAFGILRQDRPARLVLLGEGQERKKLAAMVTSLHLEDDVWMPGFITNPYVYLKHAQLFVLSSRWEGSPNVLTEAMALGIPVVSTDCPSGPREILQDGRLGPLLPMGEAKKMAAAMAAVLDNPPQPDSLMEAVKDYQVSASANRYLEILFDQGRR